MEGTTELNRTETIESPKDSPNQLLKEGPILPTNQNSPHVLQSTTSSNADISNLDRDWPEHFSFFNAQEPSHAETQEVLVEELTLTNYKNAPGSSSPSGEKNYKIAPVVRPGLWGNFRRIAGANLGNDAQTGFQNSNPRVQNSNNFPQIIAKNALKGKEVAQSQRGGNRDQQHVRKPKMYFETSSNSNSNLNSPRKRSDEKSLYGGGGFNNVEPSNLYSSNNDNLDKFDGVTLREFLKQRRTNKRTKMQIFRQIVEFLDSSHSHGASLKQLRPSYFTILPLNNVKYTGEFSELDISSQEKMEASSTKKRYSDQNQKGSNWKQQRIGEQGYYRKFGGDLFEDNLKNGGEMSKFEERWYASPEEQFNDNTCSFASNVYSLGILLFEIFCYFETWELHAAAMSDLRQRILPPNFLMENPAEAGFCLLLILPDPTSRPKARDILQSDFITGSQENPGRDIPSLNIQEIESESEILLQFLGSLKDKKEKQASKLTTDLNWLDADISQLDRIHSSKPLENELITNSPSSDNSNVYEERLMKSMAHLETAYFSLRSQFEQNNNNNNNTTNNNNNNIPMRTDIDVLKIHNISDEGNSNISSRSDGLDYFFSDLCKYARYNKFIPRGCLKNSDMLTTTNVICSLSFDRDEEYFATAGVSKKIKIFEFESLLNENVDIHYPLIEMPSRSKLSFVCWNGYIKNYLASTDYEGVVQLWDASTGQGFTQFTEHRKRAWSVDFSRVDPAKLASGSDDCTVKIWNINEKNSTDTIRNVANVCSVQFSPYSSRLLAFGSADYKTYCYDLRYTRIPWCTLSGHSKAVSFVRFLDSQTIVSASTDNSLKIWDLNKTSSTGLSADACTLTLTGHTNEKNFVGLSVHDGYIACGSETNEVYAYYKSFPMPITSHKFGSVDPITGQETNDENSQFVSSVCWRGKGNMVISTNSTGSIKVLQLV